MLTLLRATALTVFLAVFAGPALAIDPVFQDGGAAIRGYDPVAYFNEDGPVKGSPENSFSYQGATWQFTSAENRDTFAADPEKYAPAYGGYCAWAVSQGYTAPSTRAHGRSATGGFISTTRRPCVRAGRSTRTATSPQPTATGRACATAARPTFPRPPVPG